MWIMMQNFFNVSSGLLVLIYLTACGTGENHSMVKIDNGISVEGEAANKINAVYSLLIRSGSSAGGCTGTAVSDHAILFAAHCVEGGGFSAKDRQTYSANSEVCVSNAVMQNICTKTTYVPKDYAEKSQMKMAYDVAVAVFPKGTFKAYALVATEKAALNDNLVFVGYSKYDLGAGKNNKRWGKNKISNFLSQITIVSRRGASADAVGVSPGDSGGPIFKDCKVLGVASRMSGNGGSKENLHTNMTWDNNQNWMKALSAYDTHMCGLGSSSVSCPTTGQYKFDTLVSENEFPCKEATAPNTGGSAGSVGTEPEFKIVSALLAEPKSGKESELVAYVTAAIPISRPSICLLKPGANVPAAKSDCVAPAESLTEVRSKNGLIFYESGSISVSESAPNLTLLVFSSDKVINTIKIAKK